MKTLKVHGDKVQARFGNLSDGTPVLKLSGDSGILAKIETSLDAIRFLAVPYKKAGIFNLCPTSEDNSGKIVELTIPLDLGSKRYKKNANKL